MSSHPDPTSPGSAAQDRKAATTPAMQRERGYGQTCGWRACGRFAAPFPPPLCATAPLPQEAWQKGPSAAEHPAPPEAKGSPGHSCPAALTLAPRAPQPRWRGSKQPLRGPSGCCFHVDHNQGWLQLRVSEPLGVQTSRRCQGPGVSIPASGQRLPRCLIAR